MGLKTSIKKWLFPELRSENIGSYPLKDPALYELFGFGQDDDTGVSVTTTTAMQTSAVFACVDLISKTIAELPAELFRVVDGETEKAITDPLYWVIKEDPNSYQTDFEFKEYMQKSLLLEGNAYAEIVSTGGSAVAQLIPLNPKRVKPFWFKPNVKAYKYSDPYTNQERVIMFDEMLHLMRYPDEDGLRGMSPIEVLRRPIGATIAAEKYGGRFYKNNAMPGGLLKHPARLSDEGRQNLIESFSDNYSGVNNRGKFVLLEEGTEFEQLSVTPEDAQFLETRKFNVNDIARIYGVPPHMIGDLEKSSFNNIVQQSLEFAKYTLGPWCTVWEKAMRRDLFTKSQKRTHFVNFDFTELLKGEQDTRFDSYTKGINNGFLTINEVREKENMNPVKGGNQLFRSTNTLPLNEPFSEQEDDEDPIDVRSIFKGNGVVDEQRN